MKSVELFAGAGGLALGASLAGFAHGAVVEWNKWACDTIRENQRRQNPLVADWPLFEGDVRLFDFTGLADVDLLAGGPPCQPFSLGGKHRASADQRDMFPATIEAVRQLRPRAFLIENVKGLTRAAFTNYLQYTILQLSFPQVKRGQNEDWESHFTRLEREQTAGLTRADAYDVLCRVVNAADYGVPQRRERVFIVGFRHDLGVRWAFPSPTHSQDALLYSQWVSGEYWDTHQVTLKERQVMETPPARVVAQLRDRHPRLLGRPWRTVRDALVGLPDPRDKAARSFPNHVFQDGAKAYTGHTGSPLDLPAKTLKAGDHGVPGGENMLALPYGGLRYFTTRESARLQTFPDTYVLHGSWSESMRQLGNAVPVRLARIMAGSVAEKLLEADGRRLADSARRARA